MNVKSLAEKIHKSGRYGVIYEMGAGVGIAHSLMQYSGASKTVHSTHSLYNKEAFIKHFRIFYIEGSTKIPRAVSKDYCDLVFKSSTDLHKDVNFLLVSTFQLPKEAGKTKHGWIGFCDLNGVTRFYHLTFPPSMSRKEAIEEVALTGLNIINAGNQHCRFSSYIDNVVDRTGMQDLELALQAYTSSPDRNKLGVFVPTLSDHHPWAIRRIENFLRQKDDILVYKGSFNPWHAGHQHTLDKSRELYPDKNTTHVLSLSVHTYGKGEMTTDELFNRLEALRELEVPIIVITKPFFEDLTNLILDKVEGTLHLAMGDDVMDKIVAMNDSYIFSHEKISAVVVRRHNDGEKNYNQIPGVQYIDEAYPESVSSTQLRNQN